MEIQNGDNKMTVKNLWKTSVVATKVAISEIDEAIDKLFYAGKLNSQNHLSLEMQRKENCQYLEMLFDIRDYIFA